MFKDFKIKPHMFAHAFSQNKTTPLPFFNRYFSHITYTHKNNTFLSIYLTKHTYIQAYNTFRK